MIIRGFKLRDDKNEIWYDHKQKLLDRLNQICTDRNRPLVSLRINGEDAQFTGVKLWIISKLDYFMETMQSLEDMVSKIEKIREEVEFIKTQIELDRKLLISTLTRSVEANDNAKLVEQIEASICNLKLMRKIYEEKYRDENECLLQSLQKKIDDIKQLKPVEFGSQLISNKSNFLSKILRLQNTHSYTFPRIYSEVASNVFDFSLDKSNDHVLPIHYVELSSLTNQDHKLVFKTPFSTDHQIRCARVNGESIVDENISCKK